MAIRNYKLGEKLSGLILKVSPAAHSFLIRTDTQSQLSRGAIGSFILQIGFATLSFGSAVLLARIIGANDYGAYSNALGWVNILEVLGTFGFNILLVRNIANYKATNNLALLKGLLLFTYAFVLIFSIALSTILYFLASRSILQLDDLLIKSLIWALPLIPILVLMQMNGAALRGVEQVIHARLPNLIFRPSFIIFGIILSTAVFRFRVDWNFAIALNVSATVICLFISFYWAKKYLLDSVRHISSRLEIKLWLKSASVIFLYGGIQIIARQMGIVMLGSFRSPAEVGIFSVATRIAYILAFALTAIEIILAPIIVRLIAQNRLAELQAIITRTIRTAFFLVFIPCAVFIVWGRQILNLFGSEYAEGYTALILLIIGQLVNVATGPGAIILFMNGYEKTVAAVFFVTTLLGIYFYTTYLPSYGVIGAAAITTGSMIAANVILSFFCARQTNLHVTIFGKR